MANEQNLQPGNVNHKFTPEELQKGGRNSGIVKRQRKTFKQAAQWLANSDYKLADGSITKYLKEHGVNIDGLDATQLATLGVWIGAIYGKAENYKALMEANNEKIAEIIEAPSLNINIIDNSKLEKALYDEED